MLSFFLNSSFTFRFACSLFAPTSRNGAWLRSYSQWRWPGRGRFSKARRNTRYRNIETQSSMKIVITNEIIM